MPGSDEKTEEAQEKSSGCLIRSAVILMITAGINLIIGIGGLFYVVLFVVPKFEQMFKEMNLDALPEITKAVLWFSPVLAFVLLPMILLALLALVYLVFKKSKQANPLPILVFFLATTQVLLCATFMVFSFIFLSLLLPLITIMERIGK
ncbi:MAG: hypothetical protein ABSE73_11745 [Planctomycetota bacterium]